MLSWHLGQKRGSSRQPYKPPWGWRAERTVSRLRQQTPWHAGDAQPTALKLVAVCWPWAAHEEKQAWGGSSELTVPVGTSGRDVFWAVGELSLGREMIWVVSRWGGRGYDRLWLSSEQRKAWAEPGEGWHLKGSWESMWFRQIPCCLRHLCLLDSFLSRLLKWKLTLPRSPHCSDTVFPFWAHRVWPRALSVQFSCSACLTFCRCMRCSMPGLPVHHQVLELLQTHVHRVGDAIQPAHPLSSPSPPAFNLSQHQGLSSWVSFSHQVAKVLKLQHQSFQWTFRTVLL